jgi:hypothetical protein
MQNTLEPRRGRYRSPSDRRVSHGLMLRKLGLAAREERLRDLAAWLLVLPPDAVFTHVTAAWLYGWWLPQLPDEVPVFAATTAATRPRRAGMICSRLRSVAEGLTLSGLPVDAPGAVLLRAARDLAILDLVPMIDSALRLGDVDMAELAELAHSGKAGSRRLREALARCDRRSESAWETILRVFHDVADVAVEPQVVILDDQGAFVARADLVVLATGDLHEYDGAVHSESGQRARDLRRSRRLAEVGRVRRGFTASDLVRHPAVTLQELERILGRPHDPDRIQTWATYLNQSCLTAAGRIRLQNRWNTSRHWSQTPA